ncbi:MAG TPA: RodZ domain-containing protein [Gammaproteobacteria bacterium]|nr:RodZ domain-containing protein [Gammaproteobacteria bacterium]
MASNDSSVPPPKEPENRIQGLGESLRSAREAARLSLEQAGEELRIEPKFLAALEEERYDAIGIPVFAKGYLKLYCEYLGLDYARLRPLYEEKAATAPPLKGRHSIERRESTGTGMWLAVGVAVIVLVLFVLWLLQVQGPPATGTPATARALAPAPSGVRAPPESASSASATATPAESASSIASAPESAPSAGGAAESASSTGGAAESASSTGGAAESASSTGSAAESASAATGSSESALSAGRASGLAPTERGAPELRPSGAENGGAFASPPSADAQTASAPAAAASASASAPEPSGSALSAGSAPPLDVLLKFSQDSWVEVTDSSSTRLYYGLGKAGDESHVAGPAPLTVLIGNADGVVLEVDGKAYAYPRRRNGNVAYFTLKAPRE